MSADKMPAGCELDALVAERVFGWGWYVNGDGTARYFRPADAFQYGGYLPKGQTEPRYTSGLPPYSTDIRAAWLVVEKFGRVSVYGPQAHIMEEYTNENCWVCEIARGEKYQSDTASADTAPLAICRAALKAVGGAS